MGPPQSDKTDTRPFSKSKKRNRDEYIETDEPTQSPAPRTRQVSATAITNVLSSADGPVAAGTPPRSDPGSTSATATQASDVADVSAAGTPSPETDSEPSPAEAASKPRRAKGVLAVSRSKNALANPQFLFGISTNDNKITCLRDTFFQKLQNLNVELRSSAGKSSFSRDEAVQITNFFFAEVMGPVARKRLESIIREYQGHPQGSIGIRTASKAEVLSRDMGLNPDLRKFFESMHRSQRLSAHPNCTITGLHALLEDLRLHNRFQDLIDKASNKDAELIAILTEKGYKTKRGVTWKSCVVQYICDSLDISVSSLDTTCQALQGVSHIVELFGIGIITVLPVGITSKWVQSAAGMFLC